MIPSVQLGLDLDRADLDKRIDVRTRQMFDGGFVDEVARLRSHLGPTAARALGYQQVIDHLDGLVDLDDTMADIAQRPSASPASKWDGSAETHASTGSRH